MKKTAILFWSLVVGIGLSFTMSVVTAVKKNQSKTLENSSATSIPIPAEPPAQGAQ